MYLSSESKTILENRKNVYDILQSTAILIKKSLVFCFFFVFFFFNSVINEKQSKKSVDLLILVIYLLSNVFQITYDIYDKIWIIDVFYW